MGLNLLSQSYLEREGIDMEIYGTAVLAAMGILIGYLAQRSRMCFVAGVRDYILVRDRELLMGMFAFIVTIWVLTSILYGGHWLRSGVPEYGGASIRDSVERVGSFSFRLQNLGGTLKRDGSLRGVLTVRFFYVTMAGGFVLGAVSTMAGGCVLRQHVLLGQGNMDALYFIIGFYAAVAIYYGLLFKLFVRLY
jgi:hypothetical protein